jgi:predicted sugar kinase
LDKVAGKETSSQSEIRLLDVSGQADRFQGQRGLAVKVPRIFSTISPALENLSAKVRQ